MGIRGKPWRSMQRRRKTWDSRVQPTLPVTGMRVSSLGVDPLIAPIKKTTIATPPPHTPQQKKIRRPCPQSAAIPNGAACDATGDIGCSDPEAK